MNRLKVKQNCDPAGVGGEGGSHSKHLPSLSPVPQTQNQRQVGFTQTGSLRHTKVCPETRGP